MQSKNSILVALAVLFLFVSDSTAQERVPMTNARMDELLREEFSDDQIEGQDGVWRILIAEDDEAQSDEGPSESEEKPLDFDEEESPDLKAAESETAEDKTGGDEMPGSSDEEKLPPVMVVLTDDRADRMRLMMPIRKFDHSKSTDLKLALIALHSNYDRALDARYALQDGVLWSVFIHPLQSLTAGDLKNGIDQVRALRKNTGTTFTSSDLLFGGAAPKKEEKEAEYSDF